METPTKQINDPEVIDYILSKMQREVRRTDRHWQATPTKVQRCVKQHEKRAALNKEKIFWKEGAWNIKRTTSSLVETTKIIVLFDDVPALILSKWKESGISASNTRYVAFIDEMCSKYDGFRQADGVSILKWANSYISPRVENRLVSSEGMASQPDELRSQELVGPTQLGSHDASLPELDTQQSSLHERRSKIVTKQWKRLMHSDILTKLRDKYHGILMDAAKRKTLMYQMALTALDFIDEGQCAKPGTWDSECDVVLATMKELNDSLVSQKKLPIILIRDFGDRLQRKQASIEGLVHALDAESVRGEEFTVDNYDVAAGTGVGTPCNMALRDVITRLADCPDGVTPLNMDDLRGIVKSETPWPLKLHTTLLMRCLSLSARTHVKFGYGTVKGDEEGRGKSALESKKNLSDSDLFVKLGQSGTFSGPHLDNCGVAKWVRLENQEEGQSVGNSIGVTGDDFYCLEGDETTMKLLAIIDMKSLDSQIQKEFELEGDQWMPPATAVKLVPLIAGDILIMPPGTVHAEISVTDCLMTGGIAWSENMIKETVAAWMLAEKIPGSGKGAFPIGGIAVKDSIRLLLKSSNSWGGLSRLEMDELDDALRDLGKVEMGICNLADAKIIVHRAVVFVMKRVLDAGKDAMVEDTSAEIPLVALTLYNGY